MQPQFAEEAARTTVCERSINASVFMYETPFTTSGSARGRVDEQFLRKTYLRTECHFPYLRSRLRVVEVGFEGRLGGGNGADGGLFPC